MLLFFLLISIVESSLFHVRLKSWSNPYIIYLKRKALYARDEMDLTRPLGYTILDQILLENELDHMKSKFNIKKIYKK